MKRILSTAALLLLASATTAFAAVPGVIGNTFEACCALGAACCGGCLFC